MMEEIQRSPVPEHPVERFSAIVHIMAATYGVDKIPELNHFVELLDQAMNKYIFDSNHKVSPQSKFTQDRKKFIAIFRTRYLHLTDMEYPHIIGPVECKLINILLKKLMENGYEVDEFLAWLFETFLPENPKFSNPPNLKSLLHKFVWEKFLFDYRDVKKQRNEEELYAEQVNSLLNRWRAVKRELESKGDNAEIQNFREILKKFQEKEYNIADLRVRIEEYERKFKPVA